MIKEIYPKPPSITLYVKSHLSSGNNTAFLSQTSCTMETAKQTPGIFCNGLRQLSWGDIYLNKNNNTKVINTVATTDPAFQRNLSHRARPDIPGVPMKHWNDKNVKSIKRKIMDDENKVRTLKPGAVKVNSVVKKYNTTSYYTRSTRNSVKKENSRNHVNVQSLRNAKEGQMAQTIANTFNGSHPGTKVGGHWRSANRMVDGRGNNEKTITNSSRLEYDINKNNKNECKRKRGMRRYYKANYPFPPRVSKSQEPIGTRNNVDRNGKSHTINNDDLANNSRNASCVRNENTSEDVVHRLRYRVNAHESHSFKANEDVCYDPKTGWQWIAPEFIQTRSIDHTHGNQSKQSHSINNITNSKGIPHPPFLDWYADRKLRKRGNNPNNEDFNNTITRNSHSTFYSPRSREILEDLLHKIFKRFFMMISPNGRFIDRNNIILESIDVRVIEIFFPWFYEWDEQDDALNEEDFVCSCMEMYKTWSICDKNILIEWYFRQLKTEGKSKKSKADVTFRPGTKAFSSKTSHDDGSYARGSINNANGIVETALSTRRFWARQEGNRMISNSLYEGITKGLVNNNNSNNSNNNLGRRSGIGNTAKHNGQYLITGYLSKKKV